MRGVVGLIVLLLAVVVLGLWLAWAIGANYRRPDPLRAELADRLARVRLGRALPALGLERGYYLRTRPVIEIHADLGRCVDCADPEGCDRALDRTGQLPESCPNRAALTALAEAHARGPHPA